MKKPKKPAKKIPEKTIRNMDSNEPKLEKKKKPQKKKTPVMYCK
jgi:hypothetical protein